MYSASDSIIISGTSPETMIPGGIYSENFSSNKGSSIFIDSPSVSLIEGGNIAARTFTAATSGDIYIESDNLHISGNSPRNSTVLSSIRTDTTISSGNAGNIYASLENLTIENGALLGSISGFTGTSGNVFINASENIVLQGLQPEILSPSTITSSAFRFGNSGNVNIRTLNLKVQNGARIDSSTTAFGDAGSVNIDAQGSVIISSTDKTGLNRSTVSSSATLLNETLRDAFNIFTPSGAAGSVRIKAKDLILDEGARLSVQNDGIGEAGEIRVNATNIQLSDDSSITASTNGGEGGDIALETDLLALNNGSISATAQGLGLGGNITIDTTLATLQQQSRIEANAQNNQAGNIQFTANTVLASPESLITATSEIGEQFNGSVQTNIRNTQVLETIRLNNIRNDNLSISQICGFDGNRLSQASSGSYDELVKSPDILSAWEIQQNYLNVKDKYFRDAQTGEVKALRPLLGIEHHKNGEPTLIYEPSDSEHVLNLISFLERKCQDFKYS